MISIVIPTRNEEKIIEATLQRLAETFSLPHEIIVSDGGSTDRTVELAARHANTVVEFSGTHRQTIAEGRNNGAAVATGDYLVFLDADCIIPEPDRFFAQALGHFERDANLVGLTAYVRVFPENETFGDRIVFGITNLGLRLGNNLLRQGGSLGEFQMIKREAFNRAGGFRADLVTYEDIDMFRRLSRIGRTMTDPKLTVLHSGRREHQLGWPSMLGMWLVNTMFVIFRRRPYTKEWKVVR